MPRYRLRVSPPTFRPAFSEWVDHGYPVTPTIPELDPDPCPLCGAAGQLCKHSGGTDGAAEAQAAGEVILDGEG